jgi:hypothetical protein
MRFPRSFVAIAVATLIAILVLSLAYAHAEGVERVVITVQLAPELVSSLIVFAVPINVSNPSLLTVDSLYVLVGNTPKLSYAFSSIPSVIVFAEPYAWSGTTYEAWYGGANPYPSFISLPGTNASFWYAYDEFDYPTTLWSTSNAYVAASKMFINAKGFTALRYSMPVESTTLWLLSGKRALQIVFSKQYSTFVAFTLTSYNFTDFNLVRDGTDIYFTDASGTCLYYSVLYLDKASQVLKVAVNPANNTIIYMLYGGANPCTSYSIALS